MTAIHNDNTETPTVQGSQPMQPPTATTPDFDAYTNLMTIYDARRADLLPINKRALFAALKAVGIHTLVVAFDGSGDEGQIESVDAFAADNEQVALTKERIEQRVAVYNSSNVEVEHLSAREVIENMAYDFLSQTHSGWDLGEGAYGEFTFIVDDQTISLDYNERYTASNNHRHEF